LNKKNEESVFKVEMEKFKNFSSAITQLNQQQAKMLDDLAQESAKLLQTNTAKDTDLVLQAKLSLTKQLKDARVAYEEISTNLK
jgi:hypothetical protein